MTKVMTSFSIIIWNIQKKCIFISQLVIFVCILTVVRFPGASENGTQLVRSGK
jgi:hypothetical protein